MAKVKDINGGSGKTPSTGGPTRLNPAPASPALDIAMLLAGMGSNVTFVHRSRSGHVTALKLKK